MPDKLTLRALAALHDVLRQTQHGPVAPSPLLRFALAFLYVRATGERHCFAGFLSACSQTHDSAWSEATASIFRSNDATREFNAILRSLGIRPDIAFMSALADLNRPPTPATPRPSPPPTAPSAR